MGKILYCILILCTTVSGVTITGYTRYGILNCQPETVYDILLLEQERAIYEINMTPSSTVNLYVKTYTVSGFRYSGTWDNDVKFDILFKNGNPVIVPEPSILLLFLGIFYDLRSKFSVQKQRKGQN